MPGLSTHVAENGGRRTRQIVWVKGSGGVVPAGHAGAPKSPQSRRLLKTIAEDVGHLLLIRLAAAAAVHFGDESERVRIGERCEEEIVVDLDAALVHRPRDAIAGDGEREDRLHA